MRPVVHGWKWPKRLSRSRPESCQTAGWRGGRPATGKLTGYNAAVQQTYLRLWFTTLGVGKELARGYFCAVTPP